MAPRLITFLVLAVIWAVPASSQSLALEKLKFGSSSKVHPIFYLPVMAAETQGFWKGQGLDVEYVPFTSGPTLFRAVAAGEIPVGITIFSSKLPSMIRGLPVLTLADIYPGNDFAFWVLTKSSMKEPKDLKGARIGVVGLHGSAHLYGQIVAKALGLEKEVRFVGTGGSAETLAALKAERVDVIVRGSFGLRNLKFKGEVRQLVAFEDYRPKEWVEHVIFAHRDTVKARPETVKKVVRALLNASNFIKDNAAWTLETLRAENNYPEIVAKEAADEIRRGFTRDGKVSRPGLQNVIGLMVEYGIVPRDKVPPLSEIYTPELTP